MTFSLHIKDYNTFTPLSNKQIQITNIDSKQRGGFFKTEFVNDSSYKPQAFNLAGEVRIICANALNISNAKNLSIAFLNHKYKIQNFLARFCFYCIAIFLCFSAPLLADSNSFILNPMKAESFAKGQECDITKKGNICEITFRMPLDLWRVWVKNNQHIDIVLSLYAETRDYRDNFSLAADKKLRFTTLPIQSASDFISRLYEVWDPHEVYYHWTPEHLKAITHLLESYHSNQFFKLKVTFAPLSNLKEQQEVTDIFSLYKTESSRILWGLMQIKSVKTWKKYKIRLEVLEDATLPQGVKSRLVVLGSSIK